MKLNKMQIKHIRNALHSAIQNEDSLLDAHSYPYRTAHPKRVWMDGVDMKFIRQIQRQIKIWKELLIKLKFNEEMMKEI